MSRDIVSALKHAALGLALAGAFGAGTPERASAIAEDIAASRPSGPMQVTLRRQITVDDGTVRLGDLFDGPISGGTGLTVNTPVAYAPQPGRRAVLDAEWLARLSNRYQLNWRPATRLDRVLVERASTIVNTEDIRAAITEEIAIRGYRDDYELELSNRNLLIHIDPNLVGTVEVLNLALDPASERFDAVIGIPADDPRAQRFTISGRMYALIELPVPVATLRPGDVIRPGDIEWKPVRARNVRDTNVTDIDELIGMEPRRSLRQNTPVRRVDLREPRTVEKGHTVTMIYQTSVMTLSATGIAEGGGSQGELIRVRNRQTNLVVDARIVGPDRVAVQILPQLAANGGISR